MDSPLLAARAPFDLIIANILAGPLIELAPDFATALAPGGTSSSPACSTARPTRSSRAYEALGLSLARSRLGGVAGAGCWRAVTPSWLSMNA